MPIMLQQTYTATILLVSIEIQLSRHAVDLQVQDCLWANTFEKEVINSSFFEKCNFSTTEIDNAIKMNVNPKSELLLIIQTQTRYLVPLYILSHINSYTDTFKRTAEDVSIGWWIQDDAKRWRFILKAATGCGSGSCAPLDSGPSRCAIWINCTGEAAGKDERARAGRHRSHVGERNDSLGRHFVFTAGCACLKSLPL